MRLYTYDSCDPVIRAQLEPTPIWSHKKKKKKIGLGGPENIHFITCAQFCVWNSVP